MIKLSDNGEDGLVNCFKAYDIRGKLGVDLDEDIAYRIGRAYASVFALKRVALGGDVRLSSDMLKAALARGLMDSGVDVIDIGMTGTEEIYFAAAHLDVDGGIEVTASHNPIDYNGMKLVLKGARPVSRDNGLQEIEARVEKRQFIPIASQSGHYVKQSVLYDYIDHLLSYIDISLIRPLRIVANVGNGAAGHVIDAIEQRLKQQGVPVTFHVLYKEPDGHFPNGIPNPLLPENRAATIAAVQQYQADLGLAWDGDFDRCFFFDERGRFIEGYYMVGLLARRFLLKYPHEKIIYDPRLTWNTQAVVEACGGQAIESKTGHAFIKARMRQENAIYGGEMSAHHYFRDFSYCDSGMIPWLLVIALLSETGQSLSSLVDERMRAYPCSGEINFTVHNAQAVMQSIADYYEAQHPHIEHIDGLSMAFEQWRFNVRASNTEPLLRLNVESRGDEALMRAKTAELTALIQQFG